MDKITESCFNSFIANFGISREKQSIQFEHFINYLYFSKHHAEIYELESDAYEKVHTGNGGDEGIDGVLIIVNDHPIYSIEEAEETIKQSRRVDASFYFTQAKTSSGFETGDMLKFQAGVKSFFSNNFIGEGRIAEFKKICDTIYNTAAKFNINPKCHLCYASTGKVTNDKRIAKTIADAKNELMGLNLFSEVTYNIYGAEEIQKAYRQISNSITRTISLERSVSFPNIEGLKEAYIGLISSKELLKLICTDEGELLRGLFYENVRSYLGDNPVNQEITQTLLHNEVQPQFPMLNNGITIVANNVKRSGDNFTLEDFQIVNGCQTCNVLYANYKILKEETHIPFKLLCVTDSQVVNRIIRSTNRQTSITDEAFESLKPFHKKLQDFYEAKVGDDKIYYERRSGEYSAHNGCNIAKYRVFSIASQLYSYISVFRKQPHSTHRYYGNLLLQEKGLFGDKDCLNMYYTAAQLVHKVERMLWELKGAKKCSDYKYHIAMTCRILAIESDNLPQSGSNEMDRICDKILAKIESPDEMRKLMTEAVGIITDAYDAQTDKTINHSRRKEFTQEVVSRAVASIKSGK